MPKALGAELAVAWPVTGEAHTPSSALSWSFLWDAALWPAWELRPLLSAAPRTPREGLFMSGLAAVPRGEDEGHPSSYHVPLASLGMEALSEHPSQGPGLPLNLPLETSSRCWRTGCSSGSLSAPGGRMEEEDLGGVKSRPRALLWLEHYVTLLGTLGEARVKWQDA